jgi:hypothetical protein
MIRCRVLCPEALGNPGLRIRAVASVRNSSVHRLNTGRLLSIAGGDWAASLPCFAPREHFPGWNVLWSILALIPGSAVQHDLSSFDSAALLRHDLFSADSSAAFICSWRLVRDWQSLLVRSNASRVAAHTRSVVRPLQRHPFAELVPRNAGVS